MLIHLATVGLYVYTPMHPITSFRRILSLSNFSLGTECQMSKFKAQMNAKSGMSKPFGISHPFVICLPAGKQELWNLNFKEVVAIFSL